VPVAAIQTAHVNSHANRVPCENENGDEEINQQIKRCVSSLRPTLLFSQLFFVLSPHLLLLSIACPQALLSFFLPSLFPHCFSRNSTQYIKLVASRHTGRTSAVSSPLSPCSRCAIILDASSASIVPHGKGRGQDHWRPVPTSSSTPSTTHRLTGLRHES